MAYLDPGTGSMLVQTLIAVALSGLFAIKIFWRRITTRFRRRDDDSSESK